jgi:hypothetical protein
MSASLSTFSIDQSRSSSRRAMTNEECIRLLRETGWGVLCVAEHTVEWLDGLTEKRPRGLLGSRRSVS